MMESQVVNTAIFSRNSEFPVLALGKKLAFKNTTSDNSNKTTLPSSVITNELQCIYDITDGNSNVPLTAGKMAASHRKTGL